MCKQPSNLHRRQIVTLLALIIVSANSAWATNSIKSRFLSAYPSAVGTRLVTINGVGHCGACHYDFKNANFENLNRYGQAISVNGTASSDILAIGSLDSDGDGATNDTEIIGTGYCNLPTFPGLSNSNAWQVTNLPTGYTAADLSGYLVPAIYEVSVSDLGIFASHWLDFNCASTNDCSGADFDQSGTVDFQDFSYLASNWLTKCPQNWPW